MKNTDIVCDCNDVTVQEVLDYLKRSSQLRQINRN